MLLKAKTATLCKSCTNFFLFYHFILVCCILFDDNKMALPQANPIYHSFLSIVFYAELLLETANHLDMFGKIACHVEPAKG